MNNISPCAILVLITGTLFNFSAKLILFIPKIQLFGMYLMLF